MMKLFKEGLLSRLQNSRRKTVGVEPAPPKNAEIRTFLLNGGTASTPSAGVLQVALLSTANGSLINDDATRSTFPDRSYLLCKMLLAIGIGFVVYSVGAGTEYSFGEHPRFKHVVDEIEAMDEAARTRLIARADRIVNSPADIPRIGGQWIFYYACPVHNRSLSFKDGKHVCPKCGKEYSDERTALAHITMRYNKIDADVLILAKAWHLTKKDAYAKEVFRVLETYADFYPGLTRFDRWGRKGILAAIGGKRFCQSLVEATNIIKLAVAYDLVHDWKGLDPEVRAKIEKDFFEETVKCIYRFYLFNSGKNNHMTWYNAGAATAGAALGRADWLDKAIDGSKGLLYQFDASVTADGTWYEGTFAYHFYALQAIIATVQASKACDRDLTSEPALKKMFIGPLQFQYPNGQMPAINDGDRANIKGYRRTYDFAAKTWDDPILKEFVETGEVSGLRSEVYNDAGLVYLRRMAGEERIVAIMDFGQHGAGHGHPDKLNMMLYVHGAELFLDPGRLTYRCPEHVSWAKQTIAHNTVLMNCRSQIPTKGSLLMFKRDEVFDIAVAESRHAYTGVIMRRALVLFDDALVDIFSVDSKRKATFDWVLHGQAKLLTGGAPLKPIGGVLHSDAGYQHIGEVKKRTADKAETLDWQMGGNKKVRTHILQLSGAELYTGTGIGYALTSKIPLALIRIKGDRALFAAVHDLSATGENVTQPTIEGTAGVVRISFIRGDIETLVEWDHLSDVTGLTVKQREARK